MPISQHSNSEKNIVPLKVSQRIAAGGALAVIVGIFALLWAGVAGIVDMTLLFGVCGFKQSYGLPCMGCYITTSAKAFVQGRVLESFYIQPAGAILCCGLVVGGVLALLIAVFGVNFRFLHRPLSMRTFKYVVISLIIVLAGGWAVTLARDLAG